VGVPVGGPFLKNYPGGVTEVTLWGDFDGVLLPTRFLYDKGDQTMGKDPRFFSVAFCKYCVETILQLVSVWTTEGEK